MTTMTNDSNSKGTNWWKNGIYGKSDTLYPEEDYQIKALPKTVLCQELQRRLVHGYPEIIWKGKKIDCSAISDKLLLHHISLHLL